ncbi:MAG TPA: hypothetical protein VE982_07700 [Gaiellaceae bacterium]|nr:hypothetical protein [Gaiellaceae bacterium]
MGWRDRDWAKFDDDEWSELVHASAPARRKPRTRVTVMSTSLVVGVAASAAATFLLHANHVVSLELVPATPPNVVGVEWRNVDLTPASTAGRICIPTPKERRICATYAIGEKPADALTRRLRANGLTVRSVD